VLRELHVRNFAILEDVRVEFGPGLNVLTGETGAGKSILIDALGAALGQRTGTEVIRSGATEARVEAVFDLSRAPAVRAALDAAGLPGEDEVLILVREIGGRGRAYANGAAVTVGTLRTLGSLLVEIHGQHEGQRLLEPRTHLELLDAFGGEELLRAREAVEGAFRRWSELRVARAELVRKERERAQRLDLLHFQVREIDAVHPRPGELEELQTTRTRLVHAERLAEAVGAAYQAIYGGEESAAHRLGRAASQLRHAAAWDPHLAPFAQTLDELSRQLADLARDLRGYAEALEADPAQLEAVEARLVALRTLQRKYGDTVEEILAYRDRAAREIESLETLQTRLEEIEQELIRATADLARACAVLSALRRAAARRLEEALVGHLRDLGMPEAQFAVAFEVREDPEGIEVDLHGTGPRRLGVGMRGVDRVEFLFSANPGEVPRPLVRVASGGELARLMLAIRSVLALVDPTPVMVFDEVDAGVGGRAAHVIGAKLASLAHYAQVLCVTHLPQIAAMAQVHHAIRKVTAGGRTRTEVHRVEEQERVEEIARMLGADPPTEVARRHARELLERHRAPLRP
jgi:DNA repair protein RecN (Recombination protein N)